MEKAELLVELGTEEIPASMLKDAAHQFADLLSRALEGERLSSGGKVVWYTPRRIIAGLSDIPVRQDDLVETVAGPPRKVAYDAQGAPTRAAAAFAEKNSVPLSKLRIVDTAKGEYLAVVRKVRGERTAKLLQRLIPAAIGQIQFAKTMYWSGDKFRFARPLRWIVAIYAGRAIRFRIADVSSSNVTAGHRFAGKRRIKVSSLESLEELLSRNGVIADPARREAVIRSGLAREAAAAGGRLIDDPELLEMVVNLNEIPSVILGAFDRRFLALPEEILVTVMREHQKYFSVAGPEGRLLPSFLAVINLGSDPSGKIRSGHERVLRARLADAEFFWNTDRRTPLGNREAALKQVLFQEKLGSYYDKTQRVVALLPRLAGAAGIEAARLADLETAGHLLKCDLVTEMVKEFTDLQGIVGGLYARAEGYREDIWRGIYEHYQPKSTSSESPSTAMGAVLALADRLDTVSGCFTAGLIPTGSGDPFGVRRQGNGILKILLDHRISVSLNDLIDWSLESLDSPDPAVAKELHAFFEGRLRFLFAETGYSYDCVNAALAVGCDDPLDAMERVRALEEMRREPEFLALAGSFKRVMNILSRAGAVTGPPETGLMSDPEESALWRRSLEIRPQVELAQKEHRYDAALRSLASLRGAVDDFFDKVLVMAEDPAVRGNRLALLDELARLFLRIADISQIVIERSSL